MLKINFTLLTLYLCEDRLGYYKLDAIVETLRFNSTLSDLGISDCNDKLSLFFVISTQYHLQRLLKMLMDEDASKVLAKEFQAKVKYFGLEQR